MTTAAELDARTNCLDLRIRLATAETRIATLESCKHRLNGLIVARDAEIDTLTAANASLTAALAEVQHAG